MRNRLRFIAALLALLALTASVAEQAWAAACMGMDASSQTTPVASEGDSPHAASGHTPAPGEHRSHAPSDAGTCPMAAASGTACGATALPGGGSPAELGSEVHLSVPPAVDEAPGSLALSLFRPPRR